jgi:hypothetical protein
MVEPVSEATVTVFVVLSKEIVGVAHANAKDSELTAELIIPSFTAIALIVTVEAVIVTGSVYGVDDVVGLDPSVV